MNLLDHFRLVHEREAFPRIREEIEKGIEFRGTNLWILIFAILIASLGLYSNSTAVIIGAMLISPLMGPIMGLGFGMAINDVKILKRSVLNLLFATTVSLSISTLFFLLIPLHTTNSELLHRTSPSLDDALIALFGGMAGMLATSSKLKGNVIPGAAIATALMPPLCTAGFGLATWSSKYFFGALYLYLINAIFIAAATFLVARLVRFGRKWH
jgi:uncharacterized hydrophobic protein (TIGR00271 family)